MIVSIATAFRVFMVISNYSKSLIKSAATMAIVEAKAFPAKAVVVSVAEVGDVFCANRVVVSKGGTLKTAAMDSI